MNAVHVVVPDWVDDPARPSGGNVYDRRIADGLGAVEHPSTASVPDGALVLVDGLLTSPALLAETTRLRMVVLVHQPRGEPWGGALLRAVAGVVATSRWTRRWLLAAYDLDPERVLVAEPGVDPAPLSPGSAAGSALLCVAAVTTPKGYDVLATALRTLDDLDWSCRGVGATSIEPDLVAGVGDAVRLTGPMTRAELDTTYAEADLLVLASRAETYGMVVTEALARGLPVLVSDVGGVREALGGAGVLVPPDDPDALAAALRRWLTDADHRAEQRAAARVRRTTLHGWDHTVARLSEALAVLR